MWEEEDLHLVDSAHPDSLLGVHISKTVEQGSTQVRYMFYNDTGSAMRPLR